jgi:hypothetical protein
MVMVVQLGSGKFYSTHMMRLLPVSLGTGREWPSRGPAGDGGSSWSECGHVNGAGSSRCWASPVWLR